jgi:polyhydroxyalkanoate synthesis regulator phasin
MADEKREGLADELREAVERTFAAVAGSAAGTRERAQELLDEAVRRSQGARGTVEKEIESLRKRIGELESALGRSKPKR